MRSRGLFSRVYFLLHFASGVNPYIGATPEIKPHIGMRRMNLSDKN